MFSLLKELFGFAREYRKFWMIPIILLLLTVGGMLIVVEGSAVAPLLYALF